jgi:hypothetical protein
VRRLQDRDNADRRPGNRQAGSMGKVKGESKGKGKENGEVAR